MRIRFEATIDDWLELSRHEFANSSVRRWAVKFPIVVCYFVLAALILSAVPFVWPDAGVVGHALILIATGAALVFALLAMLKLIEWIHSWHVRQTLQGRDGMFKVGWHEMQYHDGVLHVTTEWMACRIDVRAIAAIVHSGRWAFVFIESGQSFVVPLYQFPSREGHVFIAELKEAWESCDPASSNEPPPLRFPAPDERIKEVR